MQSSIQNISYLLQVSDKMLKYLSNRDLDSLQLLLYNLIERQRHSAISLEVLLKEYQREPLHDHSVGIILRSALLDALIGFNLYAYILENENETPEVILEKLNEMARAFLADGIGISITLIESYASHSFINGKMLREFYIQVVKKYGEFFEPYELDGSKPVLLKFGFDLSPKNLYKRMIKHDSLKNARWIYDKYMLYSKYDHQSILYRQFFTQENDIKKERIHESTVDLVMNSFAIHCVLLHSFPDDEFISDQYRDINEFVGKIPRPPS